MYFKPSLRTFPYLHEQVKWTFGYLFGFEIKCFLLVFLIKSSCQNSLSFFHSWCYLISLLPFNMASVRWQTNSKFILRKE